MAFWVSKEEIRERERKQKSPSKYLDFTTTTTSSSSSQASIFLQSNTHLFSILFPYHLILQCTYYYYTNTHIYNHVPKTKDDRDTVLIHLYISSMVGCVYSQDTRKRRDEREKMNDTNLCLKKWEHRFYSHNNNSTQTELKYKKTCYVSPTYVQMIKCTCRMDEVLNTIIIGSHLSNREALSIVTRLVVYSSSLRMMWRDDVSKENINRK